MFSFHFFHADIKRKIQDHLLYIFLAVARLVFIIVGILFSVNNGHTWDPPFEEVVLFWSTFRVLESISIRLFKDAQITFLKYQEEERGKVIHTVKLLY